MPVNVSLSLYMPVNVSLSLHAGKMSFLLPVQREREKKTGFDVWSIEIVVYYDLYGVESKRERERERERGFTSLRHACLIK